MWSQNKSTEVTIAHCRGLAGTVLDYSLPPRAALLRFTSVETEPLALGPDPAHCPFHPALPSAPALSFIPTYPPAVSSLRDHRLYLA